LGPNEQRPFLFVRGPGFTAGPPTPTSLADRQRYLAMDEELRKYQPQNPSETFSRGPLSQGPEPQALLPPPRTPFDIFEQRQAQGERAANAPGTPVEGPDFRRNYPGVDERFSLNQPRTDTNRNIEFGPRPEGQGQYPQGIRNDALPARLMSDDQVMAQAQRLGVPIDEGALRRGTPLTREGEHDKLQLALDQENDARIDALRGSRGRAEDQVFQQFKADRDAEALRRVAEEEAAKQSQWVLGKDGRWSRASAAGDTPGTGSGGIGSGRYSGGPGRGGSRDSSGPGGFPRGSRESKLWADIATVVNAPMSFVTNAHLPGRQALPLMTKEMVFGGGEGRGTVAQAVAQSAKLFVNLKGNKAEMDGVLRDMLTKGPEGKNFDQMNGHLTHFGGGQSEYTPPGRVAGFIQRLPLIGNTQAAAAHLLNVLRVGSYNRVANLMDAGDKAWTEKDYKQLAGNISHQSGYGNVPSIARPGGVNVIFSAPYWSAKIATVTDPFFAPSGAVRSDALQALLSVAAVGLGGGFAGRTAYRTLGLPGSDFDPFDLGSVLHAGPYTTIDPWGGYGSMLRLIAKVGEAAKNGDPGAAAKAATDFTQGQLGPTEKLIADIANGKWYQEGRYQKMTGEEGFTLHAMADRLKNLVTDPTERRQLAQQMFAPIFANSLYNNIKANQNEGGMGTLLSALSSLPSFGAISVESRAPAAKVIPQAEAKVLADPEALLKQMPPGVAAQVQGQDPSSLGQRELDAVRNAGGEHMQDLLQQRTEERRTSGYDYDTALQAAMDQKDAIRQSYAPAFDMLEKQLASGGDPHYINQARKDIQNEMYKEINAVQMPKYEGPEHEQSDIQKLLAGYQQLSSIADFDQRDKAQQAYRDAVKAEYGDAMSQRFNWNVEPVISEKSHPLTQMYQAVQPLTSPYFNIDSSTQAGRDERHDYAVAHPASNVALSYFYGTPLYSADAARQYNQQYPGARRDVNIEAPKQQNVASIRTLERAGYGGRELLEFEALPQNDNGRAQSSYLAAHPLLNAQLYGTGHTSHFYSLEAYDMAFRR